MQGTALPLDLDFLNEKYHWLKNGLKFYNSAWGKHTERLKYIKADSVHRANRVREVCLHKSNPGPPFTLVIILVPSHANVLYLLTSLC